MTNRAKASGVVGTIIDGRLRDLQEHRDLGFPVSEKISSYGLLSINSTPRYLLRM